MKERPILFNAEMVRAILGGRKTQTRRALKPQPPGGDHRSLKEVIWGEEAEKLSAGRDLRQDRAWAGFSDARTQGASAAYYGCPYGQPGDRLWVRETWGVVSHYFDEMGNATRWEPDRPATEIHEMPFGNGYYHGHVIYAADGGFEWAGDDDGGGEPRSAWKPSIHMPRRASRITLEITDVRVERLQDISEADAIDEGVDANICRQFLETSPSRHTLLPAEIHGFAGLWSSTGGDWDANPWVWAVEFKRVAQELPK